LTCDYHAFLHVISTPSQHTFNLFHSVTTSNDVVAEYRLQNVIRFIYKKCTIVCALQCLNIESKEQLQAVGIFRLFNTRAF